MARSRPVTNPPQRSQSATRKPRNGSATAMTVMRRSNLEALGCGCVFDSVTPQRMPANLPFASPEAAGFEDVSWHEATNDATVSPAATRTAGYERQSEDPMSAAEPP